MNKDSIKLECLKLVIENGSRADQDNPIKQAQILYDFVTSDKEQSPQVNKGGRPRKK